jgi:hypothetical protein
MVNSKVEVPLFVFFAIVFSLLMPNTINFLRYTYIMKDYLTFDSTANKVLMSIKTNDIESVKYSHCGFVRGYEKNLLDSALEKYWLKIQKYNWINAYYNSNQNKNVDSIYFENILDENSNPIKIYIHIESSCTRDMYPFLDNYYGFTPDY